MLSVFFFGRFEFFRASQDIFGTADESEEEGGAFYFFVSKVRKFNCGFFLFGVLGIERVHEN